MAGFFFSRAFNRCARGSGVSSFTNKCRYVNTSRSKVNGSLQRKIHTSSKRNSRSLLFFSNSKAVSQIQSPLASLPSMSTGSLLNKIQANGIHAVAAGSSDTGVGSSSVESSVGASDSTINPKGDDEPTRAVGTGDESMESLSDGAVLSDPSILDMTSPFDLVGMVDVPLSTLGLGGYTPIGLIQNILSFAHLDVGLPWWAAIITGTIILRSLVAPVMKYARANQLRLSAIQPEMNRIQQKMTEASNLQNPMHRVIAAQELQDLFKKHNCHPIKGLIAPLIQMPLFISFFVALRQMSYLPVETMKTGGLLWFTDLTAADPYFILPVFSAAAMLLTFETGAEGSPAQMAKMKYFFRGMCVVMIPLTYTFPTGIFLYWVTSSSISLIRIFALSIPGVREYLNLPKPPPPTDLEANPGGFIKNFKAGFKNSQLAAIVKQEEKMKQKEYIDSLQNTYKETFEYNPRTKENEKLFQKAKQVKGK